MVRSRRSRGAFISVCPFWLTPRPVSICPRPEGPLLVGRIKEELQVGGQKLPLSSPPAHDTGPRGSRLSSHCTSPCPEEMATLSAPNPGPVNVCTPLCRSLIALEHPYGVQACLRRDGFSSVTQVIGLDHRKQ